MGAGARSARRKTHFRTCAVSAMAAIIGLNSAVPTPPVRRRRAARESPARGACGKRSSISAATACDPRRADPSSAAAGAGNGAARARGRRRVRARDRRGMVPSSSCTATTIATCSRGGAGAERTCRSSAWRQARSAAAHSGGPLARYNLLRLSREPGSPAAAVRIEVESRGVPAGGGAVTTLSRRVLEPGAPAPV